MKPSTVAVIPYEFPGHSVRRAVVESGGLTGVPFRARVFIKPNIVFWSADGPFPKWGTITTSRVVEDVVVLLKEYGIDDITIGEGMVAYHRDRRTPAHAFESLGYNRLGERYGVKTINVMERPFARVDLGDGMRLNFNTDILASDLVVNLPVFKTHVQTVVSLGLKNLKGTIDLASRKRCHNADPAMDLHQWIARLADPMPPMFTLIDGIYANERGPGPDGRIYRTNVLIASRDRLSADMVGARLLGYRPDQVPHLALAAGRCNRPLDFSDVALAGSTPDAFSHALAYNYDYVRTEDGSELPAVLIQQGLRGVSYRQYDTTMCTYCSRINGLALAAIRSAWRGEAWDRVEILTGKRMQPTPGMKQTILIGQCMVNAHRDNPAIATMIPVKGCPPKPEDLLGALHRAGIFADAAIFRQAERMPAMLMKRYQGKPEFDETLFQVA